MKQQNYTKCLALLLLLLFTIGAKLYGQNYPISNVTGTHIISAKLLNYDTLTYIAGVNGSITGTLQQLVENGGSGTAVTAVPNTGYSFNGWSDGSTTNPRTDVNVTASMCETAYFSAIVLPYVNLSTNNISFNSSGGSLVVQVNSNTNWTATTNNNWLNVAFDSTGNGAITITCAQNSSTAARSGSVNVSGGGGTITVTQLPAISYDNKTMTINLNNHTIQQVHDFISDTLSKIYSNQVPAIDSALLTEGYKLGYSPSVSCPQTVSNINVSLSNNNSGSVTICLPNFELDFDEGTGYCDPREYINFGINITANLQLVADSFAYKLNITNAKVSLAANPHFSAGFKSGHKFWCYLDPFADFSLLINDLINKVLPGVIGWFAPTTFALSNTSIPLFQYAQVCSNLSEQDVQSIMNSFPMSFTLSNDGSGNIVLGMNFMQGTVPGDNSFTQYNPQAPANPSFDYMGLGCPYYAFQGAFSNWTTNKPAGDALALETLLLNSMHSFATPSIRISLPWKDIVGDLPAGSKDTSTLTPAVLNAAIQAIPPQNWVRTDSIINLAQRMGFDVIPQLAQQESDVATMNGQTMAPDSNNGTGESPGYSYVNGNTYLYYLKIFAHAAVQRYQNKISIWAIEAELNAAKYAKLVSGTRHGNLWEDESKNGFQDRVWRVLADAVRQEDPTAKLTTALHMINMVGGLQRFAPDCDIVGVNVYPNSYFAIPVMGFAVGEMVWATRRALLGLNIKNPDGSEKIIHVTETNYPAMYQNDPLSNISLNSNLTYYSWGRQSQYMTDAITTSMNNGAKGFFWWGFLDKDSLDATSNDGYANYGSLIVRNSNPIQYKSAAATFQQNANTTSNYPGKSLVTLTNRTVGNSHLGGLVALTAERDSLHSGDSVYTTKSRTHISQTYKQYIQGLKHQSWNQNSPEYLLKQTFSTSTPTTTRNAWFTSTQPISFKLLLDSVNNLSGTMNYQDPWYVNSSGTQLNAFRSITLSPSFSDSIFLNQNTQYNPSFPIYSISVPTTQTLNGFTSYFLGWNYDSTKVTLAQVGTNPSGYDQKAVVFTGANATVTANYKAHLGSSLADATGGNGRKIVQDANGVPYAVYSSAGSIWFTYSNGNGGWTPEVKLGDGKNPSIAITTGNELRLVWEQDPGNGMRVVYYRSSTNNGSTWTTRVKLDSSAQSYDATPVALNSSCLRALWQNTDGISISYHPPTYSTFSNTTIGGITSTSQLPSACMLDNLTLAIAYQDSNKIKYGEMYFGNSDHANLSWNVLQEISASSSTGNTNPSITVDNNSYTLYLAWENTTTHKIYCRHSDAGGTNWGAIKEFTHGTDQLSKPSIGISYSNCYPTLLLQYGTHIGVSYIFNDTSWSSIIDLGEGMCPSFTGGSDSYSSVVMRTTGSSAPYSLHPTALPNDIQFVDGTMSSNTTWSGLVNVYGTVTVASGYTLTIDSGTLIIFASGASLVVNGTLNAIGTATDSIHFDKAGTSTWGGIQFNAGSSGSVEYCSIGNATNGISLNGTNAPLIAYNTISACSNYGIYCYSASPYIHHNKVTGTQQYGLRCDYYSSPTLGDSASPAGPGYNVIAQNTYGVYTTSSSSPILGVSSSGAAGYNSIYNNMYQDLIAAACGTVYAQNNWWNGTPKLVPLYTTIYTTPMLSSNPNPSVTTASGSSFAALGSKTPTINASIIGTSTSSGNDGLSDLLLSELNGNYDAAITGYLQKLKADTSSITKKYCLARLSDCYSKGAKKDFSTFLNNNIRTNLKATDELYAATLEVESIHFVQGGSYDKALENYQTLIKTFSKNDDVFKHALFNAGYLYYHPLKDTVQGKKYFAQLKAHYPADELTTTALMMHGLTKMLSDTQATKTPLAEATTTGLMGNYPNPFNPTTTITYSVGTYGHTSLRVYDVLGREIVTLVNGMKEPGTYNATFDGSRFASGMYFARFIVNSQSGKQIVQVKKMLMLK